MATVEIDQRWVDEIESLSNGTVLELPKVVDEAIRQHMFKLRQEKIDQERRYYEAHYGELAKQYLNQYIAIHNNAIVDADNDGRILARRVRHKFGRVPIAIIQVQETPEPAAFTIRSPRLANS